MVNPMTIPEVNVMSKTTEQAKKAAFLPKAFQKYLNADVDSIQAEGAQVANLVAMINVNIDTLNAETIKLYLDNFASALKASGKSDDVVKVFKSRRKRILEFAIGACKAQQGKDIWKDKETNVIHLSRLATEAGSLGILYKMVGDAMKDEQDEQPEQTEAQKFKASLDKFAKAGLSKQDMIKMLNAWTPPSAE